MYLVHMIKCDHSYPFDTLGTFQKGLSILLQSIPTILTADLTYLTMNTLFLNFCLKEKEFFAHGT